MTTRSSLFSCVVALMEANPDATRALTEHLMEAETDGASSRLHELLAMMDMVTRDRSGEPVTMEDATDGTERTVVRWGHRSDSPGW